MAKDYVTVEGLVEVQQMLRDTPRRIVEQYFPAALAAGAAVIEAELHARTPFQEGKTEGRPHLRDSLVTEVAVNGQALHGTADVGYGAEGFRAVFVEYGHGPNTSAHPFMRPGTDAAAAGAIEAFADSIADSINRGN